MDVVKRNIEALRGAIFIESAENEGVMIRIQLPLTLAIIDGFMFTVNGSYYIVPLDLVREAFRDQARDCRHHGQYERHKPARGGAALHAPEGIFRRGRRGA